MEDIRYFFEIPHNIGKISQQKEEQTQKFITTGVNDLSPNQRFGGGTLSAVDGWKYVSTDRYSYLVWEFQEKEEDVAMSNNNPPWHNPAIVCACGGRAIINGASVSTKDPAKKPK